MRPWWQPSDFPPIFFTLPLSPWSRLCRPRPFPSDTPQLKRHPCVNECASLVLFAYPAKSLYRLPITCHCCFPVFDSQAFSRANPPPLLSCIAISRPPRDDETSLNVTLVSHRSVDKISNVPCIVYFIRHSVNSSFTRQSFLCFISRT